MRIRYPHKLTVVIGIVCVFGVVGTLLYVNRQTGQQIDNDKVSVFAQAGQNSSDQDIIETDSEWRKSFLDASTTSSLSNVNAKNSTPGTPEKLTTTAKFGRDVFTQYANLKQAGLIKNTEVVDSTVSGILAQNEMESGKPRIYTMNDILVNPDKSNTALKEYGNVVGQLFKTYAPTKDDASLALAGMQEKDPDFVRELGENVVKYNVILSTLLRTPAPSSLRTNHLDFINGASYMIFIASSLQASQTDPLRALNGLRQYETAYPLILQNIISVRSTIGSAGITYTASEGGSFFKIPVL